MIQTLRSKFPRYPIAYSDHTPDADMDIAAVALGANLKKQLHWINVHVLSIFFLLNQMKWHLLLVG